jgi:hypothetical protein
MRDPGAFIPKFEAEHVKVHWREVHDATGQIIGIETYQDDGATEELKADDEIELGDTASHWSDVLSEDLGDAMEDRTAILVMAKPHVDVVFVHVAVKGAEIDTGGAYDDEEEDGGDDGDGEEREFETDWVRFIFSRDYKRTPRIPIPPKPKAKAPVKTKATDKDKKKKTPKKSVGRDKSKGKAAGASPS